MSIWSRGRRYPQPTSSRSYPLSFNDYLAMRAGDGIPMGTMEDALRGVAVAAAVDLLAGVTSELPIEVFSGTGASRVRRPVPGNLLDPAGDGDGVANWLYMLLGSWLLRGNNMGAILDQRQTYIAQLDLWDPDVTVPSVSEGKVSWTHRGKAVTEPMWHGRVHPLPERVLGQSVIGRHASQLKMPLAAQRFGLDWFERGGRPGTILSNDQADIFTFTPDQIGSIKARFTAGLTGTEPSLLGRGWTWQQVQIKPEESQFLATIGASDAQCARMFGPGVAEVLGYESGGSMTYTNVDSRMLQLFILTLGKWLQRADRVLSMMLPRPQYAMLDRDAILATTTLQRYQAHASALKAQWKVPNEVRDVEYLPPVPWGNEPITSSGSADPGTSAGMDGGTAQ
jgi:HK97 family phage portal protein